MTGGTLREDNRAMRKNTWRTHERLDLGSADGVQKVHRMERAEVGPEPVAGLAASRSGMGEARPARFEPGKMMGAPIGQRATPVAFVEDLGRVCAIGL